MNELAEALTERYLHYKKLAMQGEFFLGKAVATLEIAQKLGYRWNSIDEHFEEGSI